MTKVILAAGSAMVALVGCAHDSWASMQEEFPDVRANCGLQGASLSRDAHDKRLLRLTFRDRSAVEIAARADGSLGCVEAWASERGYTLTTEGV
ncbi:MAG TPA: hypothetical protein VI168_15500 [Croceibacterium sp.]